MYKHCCLVTLLQVLVLNTKLNINSLCVVKCYHLMATILHQSFVCTIKCSVLFDPSIRLSGTTTPGRVELGWLGGLFYGVSAIFGSPNAELSHCDKFQTIQFSSIWPLDRTLSGATTPSQSGHPLEGESYPSAEKQYILHPQPTRWSGTGSNSNESITPHSPKPQDWRSTIR